MTEPKCGSVETARNVEEMTTLESDKDLSGRLLELHYGLLAPAEAAELEARIASDPAYAAAWADVQRSAALIKQAARGPEITGTVNFQAPLPTAVATPNTARTTRNRFLDRLGVVTGIAASVLFFGSLLSSFALRSEVPTSARLLVAAPAELHARSAQQFTAKLVPGSGQTLPAEIDVALATEAGQPLLRWKETTDADGFVAVHLPDIKQPPGNYHLSVMATDPRQRIDALIPVRETRPWIDLATDADRYQGGETIHYRLLALNPVSGRPVEATAISFRIETPSRSVLAGSDIASTTDTGVVSGSFRLPKELENGAYKLAATIDGREVASKTLAIVSHPTEVPYRLAESGGGAGNELRLNLQPSGGTIVPHLPATVYFAANLPDGKPVDLSATINRGAAVLANVESELDGMGVFTFDPETQAGYSFHVTEPATPTATHALPAADPHAFATLDARKTVFAATEAIAVAVKATEATRPLAVSATCRDVPVGQTVLLSAKGTREVTVPLAKEVSGVVGLTLFDYSKEIPQAISQVYVYRMPAQQLNVQVSGSSESNLGISVKDQAGAPAPAVLSLSKETNGLPARFYLQPALTDSPPIPYLDEFLDEESHRAPHMKLLLGARGKGMLSRMAAGNNSMLAMSENGPLAPSIYDTLRAEASPFPPSIGTARPAFTFPWLKNVTALAGLIIGVLAGIMLLADWKKNLRIWLPTFSVAAASLLMGFFLSPASRKSDGLVQEVAFHPPVAREDVTLAKRQATSSAALAQSGAMALDDEIQDAEALAAAPRPTPQLARGPETNDAATPPTTTMGRAAEDPIQTRTAQETDKGPGAESLAKAKGDPKFGMGGFGGKGGGYGGRAESDAPAFAGEAVVPQVSAAPQSMQDAAAATETLPPPTEAEPQSVAAGKMPEAREIGAGVEVARESSPLPAPGAVRRFQREPIDGSSGSNAGLWIPFVRTDPNGNASITLPPLPEGTRVRIDAHDEFGRLGTLLVPVHR